MFNNHFFITSLIKSFDLLVASLQKELPRFLIVAVLRQLPAQRVGESIVSIEEKRNVERITDRLARNAGIQHNADGFPVELLVPKRERLEESEHRPKLLVDRSSTVVVEHQLRLAVSKRCLRDRGVSVSSKDALVESRYERGEELSLAYAPRRRPAHYLLRQLRERATEIFLAIAEGPHDAWCVAVHKSDETEQRLVGKAMSAVNFLESHASSIAASPASSRCREAPSAALTTISNILSSPYFA